MDYKEKESEIKKALEQLSCEELEQIIKNISKDDEITTDKILKEIKVLLSDENKIKKLLERAYEDLKSIKGLVICYDSDMNSPFKDQEDVEVDFGEEINDILERYVLRMCEYSLYDKALKFIICTCLLVSQSEYETDYIYEMGNISEREEKIKEMANITNEKIDSYYSMGQNEKYSDICDFFLDDTNYLSL